MSLTFFSREYLCSRILLRSSTSDRTSIDDVAVVLISAEPSLNFKRFLTVGWPSKSGGVFAPLDDDDDEEEDDDDDDDTTYTFELTTNLLLLAVVVVVDSLFVPPPPPTLPLDNDVVLCKIPLMFPPPPSLDDCNAVEATLTTLILC